MGETLRLSFADFASERQAISELILVLKQRGYDDPDSIFGTKLTVEEAMINAIRERVVRAIKESSELGKDTSATIEAVFNDGQVKISVMDHNGIVLSQMTLRKPI